MISDPLIALLKDPTAYVLLVAGSGLIYFYVKRLIASGVEHQFALRLEDHKQSLRLAAEAARFEYEHRLSQANLYASNRHVAALDVYRALRVAHGHCLNLLGLRHELTFEEFNKADLTDYMTSRDVPKGKQEEILGLVDSNRAGAVAEMQKYMQMLEKQEAEKKLGEARNKALLNELYFDDQVIAVINKFLSVMDKWMLYIRFPPDRDERKNAPTREQTDAALESVHTALRERLRGMDNQALRGIVEVHKSEGN